MIGAREATGSLRARGMGCRCHQDRGVGAELGGSMRCMYHWGCISGGHRVAGGDGLWFDVNERENQRGDGPSGSRFYSTSELLKINDLNILELASRVQVVPFLGRVRAGMDRVKGCPSPT